MHTVSHETWQNLTPVPFTYGVSAGGGLATDGVYIYAADFSADSDDDYIDLDGDLIDDPEERLDALRLDALVITNGSVRFGRYNPDTDSWESLPTLNLTGVDGDAFSSGNLVNPLFVVGSKLYYYQFRSGPNIRALYSYDLTSGVEGTWQSVWEKTSADNPLIDANAGIVGLDVDGQPVILHHTGGGDYNFARTDDIADGGTHTLLTPSWNFSGAHFPRGGDWEYDTSSDRLYHLSGDQLVMWSHNDTNYPDGSFLTSTPDGTNPIAQETIVITSLADNLGWNTGSTQAYPGTSLWGNSVTIANDSLYLIRGETSTDGWPFNEGRGIINNGNFARILPNGWLETLPNTPFNIGKGSSAVYLNGYLYVTQGDTLTANDPDNVSPLNQEGIRSPGKGFARFAIAASPNVGTTYTVTNTDDSGEGSLRWAIEQANTNVGTDTILFNIPGIEPQTINVSSQLPEITEAVFLDATSQPTYQGSPVIVLNGSAAGADAVGLNITAGNSTIRGLAIYGFSGWGMRLTGGGNNTIQGNIIGDGGGGIYITSALNLIGGATVTESNAIANNNNIGISISALTATGNQILNNLIQNNDAGVQISDGASNNLITENVISNNTNDGIAIVAGESDATNNAIFGNNIYDNGGLGIDLGNDGVTTNDEGDSDGGANALQNYPVIISATLEGENTLIAGELNSLPSSTYRIEIFSNSSIDISGNGEGENLLTSLVVTTDESGNASFSVTLPVMLPEEYYITATATDALGNTSEFSAPIQIINNNLPDLIVGEVTAADTAALGETISVSWTITNQGLGSAINSWYDEIYISDDQIFDDNDTYVEYNWSGEYIPLEPGSSYTLNQDIYIPEYTTGGLRYLLFVTDVYDDQEEADETNNVVAQAINITAPNLVITSVTAPTTAITGQSIDLTWVVTNQGAAPTSIDNSWYDYIYFSRNDILGDDDDVYITNIWSSDYASLPLNPAENYTVEQSVFLPSEALGSGYLLFATDRWEYQGESHETDNVFAQAIDIAAPDLIVSAATAPPSGVVGEIISVSWTVRNQGTVTASRDWQDRIYISDDETLDGSDTFITSQSITSQTPLAADASYSITQDITLPNTTLGNRYLLFVADGNNAQGETDETNNVQAVAIELSAPDLVVSTATAPASGVVGEIISVSWTVRNQGAVTAFRDWQDRIYISDDETFDGSDTFIVSQSITSQTPLAADGSYNITRTITLPNTTLGNRYLLFVADGNNAQSETDETNNVRAVAIELGAPDLVVTAATAPASGVVGEIISVSWTVTNQGTVTASRDWQDRIYISDDETFDGSDIFITSRSITSQTPLAADASYSITQDITLPNTTLGNRYLLFVADGNNAQGETDETNNVQAVAIELSAPDLVVSTATAPASGVVGEIISVSWTVRNQGAVTAFRDWQDRIYISDDETFDGSDTFIVSQSITSQTPLAADGSYNITRTITLPNTTLGNRYLLFVADGNNAQSETDETNNVRAVAIELGAPDLVVTAATAPASLTLGGTTDLSWTVSNIGNSPAPSDWFDRVYLSNDTTFDSSDTLLTSQSAAASTPLAVGDSYTLSATNVTVPLTDTGDRYLLFVADATSNQGETNENNNVFSLPVTIAGALPGARSATVSGDVFLGGNYIELGLSRWGSFGTNATKPSNFYGTNARSQIGMSADFDGFLNGQDLRFDYFLPGSPEERWVIGYQAGGSTFTASNAARTGSTQISNSVTNTSTSDQLSAVSTGSYNNTLGITQQIGFRVDDKYFRNIVTLTNISAQTLNSVRYMRSVDPDNTVDLGGSFTTDNIVQATIAEDGRAIVEARTTSDSDPVFQRTGSRAPIFFYSNDPRAVASTFGFTNTNPYAPLAYDTPATRGQTIRDDQAITLTFDVGTLLPGEAATFVYYTSLDDRNFEDVIEELERPDLTVTSVTPGANPAEFGSSLDISWVIANNGLRETTGGWTDRIYLSSDATLSGDDLLLSSLPTGETTLFPSGNISRTTSINLPFDDNSTAGSYYILVQADALGNQLESVETNNVRAAAIELTLPPLPDLVISDATAPASLILGQTGSISWTVTNQGVGVASEDWSDRVYLSVDDILDDSDILLLTETIASQTPLDAASSYTISRNFTPGSTLTPGAYNLLIVTDSDRIQRESDETNNLRFVPLSINAPDLVVSSITAPVESVSGQPLEISWTVTNQGQAATGGTWTDYVYLVNADTGAFVRNVGNFSFTGTLAAGASINRTQSYNVPLELAGNFRVVVRTDNNNNIPEGTPNEANNTTIGDRPITIRLAPIPNLQISSVTTPTTAFSSQQTVVSWQVTNTGNGATSAPIWYDAVYLSLDTTFDDTDVFLGEAANSSYLNSGESYTNSLSVTLPRGIDSNYYFLVKTDSRNNVNELSNEGDNFGVGGPTRINLTPPPDLQVTNVNAPAMTFSGQPMNLSWTVTNEGPGRTLETAWYDRIFMSEDEILDSGDRSLAEIFRNGALNSGESYTASTTVNLPIGVSGNYYFFVRTDSRNQVYENIFENNNVNYDTTATVITLTPPPDLEVDFVTIPNTARAGSNITINYGVTNYGASETPNFSWQDTFYLSLDNQFDPTTDIRLGNVTRFGALNPDQGYERTVNFTLSNTLAGNYYLFVTTDSSDQVFELDNANNTRRSNNQVQITASPADLVVNTTTVPTTGEAGKSLRVQWSVSNQGTGDTIVTSWTDRIIASTDGVLGNADDVVLANFNRTGILNPGNSYSREEFVNLPFALEGNYQLFVVTDAGNTVYEASNENNNASVAIPVTISRQTPDLQVTQINVPATVSSGTPLTISWTVQNLGTGRTNSNFWYDDVYLSVDPNISASDIKLGSFYRSGALEPTVEYTATANFNLPIDLNGSYYVIVRTDRNNLVTEGALENNNDQASDSTVAVSLSPVPDLVVDAVDAPEQAIAGQPFSLTWTVTNNGAVTTGTWYDAFYLSRDQVFDRNSDIYLGFQNRTALGAGESYTTTQAFNLPRGLAGLFYVFAVTDGGNAIYERNGENNNTNYDGFSMEVILPPPSDLVVTDIVVPTNAVPGQPITINYTVQNQGTDAALGSWYDAVYISADNQWDIGDALVGQVLRSGTIASGNSYSGTITANLPGVTPGNYYAIVRSDIRNQVPEINEANNTGVSTNQVSIDAEQLIIDVADTATLRQGQSIYYRFNATAGQTIRLRLDSQNNQSFNELYVRQGAMPSRGEFDVTGIEPFTADPEILLPITQDGTYYVLAYGAQATSPAEYTIVAEDVPLSILDVSTNRIGNSGSATLSILGARFTEDTIFQLISPDGDVIAAGQVYLANSTQAFATFDLFNQDVGLYDVRAIQGFDASARLEDVVTVEAGTGFRLSSSLNGQQEVRPNRNYLFNVDYGNAGDSDTKAPLLIVQSATNTPLGLELNNLGAGAPLHLLGVSFDGPLNILRPGDTNSIPVYFNSATNEVNFSISTYSVENSTSIDLNSFEASIRPAGLTDAQWNSFIADIAPRVQTYGQYANLLNDLSEQLSGTGQPIYDVRELFARAYSENANFFATATLAGELRNASNNSAIANTEIAAYRLIDGGMELAGITTTNDQGQFQFSYLTNGQYEIIPTAPYVFDNNRDSIPDSVRPTFTITDTSVVSAGTLYADIPTAAPPIIQESTPSLARDSAGNLHLLWTREGQLWHAVNNGSGFEAQPLSQAFGSDVKLLINPNLINGTSEGLIATWSSGEGNESEIYYAIGQATAGGGYQWTAPIQLTNNSLYDGAFDLEITDNGTPLFIWQRQDFSIEDDADLYYGGITVENPEFLDPLSNVTILTTVANALQYSDAELEALGIHRVRYAQDLGRITIPSWVPFISGTYEAQFRADLVGQIDCTLILGANGQLRFKVGDNGELTGEVGGQARWTTNDDCEYEFQNARIRGVVAGGLNIPLTDYRLGPFAGIKIGPRIELAGGANLIWDAGSDFPSWPSRVEGSFRGSLGANVEGKVSIPILGEVKVTGRVLGNFNFKADANGLGPADPFFSVSVLLRAEATVFGRKRFIDWTGTWPGQDLGGQSVDGFMPSDLFGFSEQTFYDETLIFSISTDVDTGTLNDYSDDNASALTANLYEEGTPVLTKDNNGILYAGWTNQDGVVISQLNAATGQWLAPSVIAGSAGLANSDLVLAFDGDGDGLAVWSSQDVSGLNENNSQEEIRNSFIVGGDLVFSVYDATTTTWSSASPLFTLTGADRSLALGKDTDGNLVASWLHDHNDRQSTLYATIWDADTNVWSAPATIASGFFSGQPSVSALGAQPIIMWTQDDEAGINVVQANQSLKYSLFDGVAWSTPLDFTYSINEALAQNAISIFSDSSDFSELFGSSIPLPSPPEECCDCEEGDPECDDDDDDNNDDDNYDPPVRRPSDPNDILGPEGFGDERWINARNPLAYTIRFENEPTASAPAQEVIITQYLDADLDWRTFRIDDFGWGDLRFDLPGDRSFYSNRIDLRATQGFYVDVSASIDVLTGLATWRIATVDPTTGEAPLDAQTGFLPINDENGLGEGFVSYSVRTKRDITTGSVIDAEARIVFDTEAPIDTPPIFNTIDVGVPTSSVTSLPEVSDSPEFLVTWSGSDDPNGSALAGYTIYVSVNAGAFTPWLTNTTLTEATYIGELGNTYSFYSVAADHAGNVEAPPTTADALIRVAGGLASLGDLVWVDSNANGLRDADEPGLAGVSINLYDGSNTLVATTTTDTNGIYSFTDLNPGDYVVEFVPGTGYLFSPQNQGSNSALDSDADPTSGRSLTVTLNPRDNNLTVDAGVYQFATIQGQKFHDLDGDGVKDPTEPGLSGWTIYLDANRNGQLDTSEISTVTDANGNYIFTDLKPGTYNVAEVMQPGWQQTFPGTSNSNAAISTSASDAELYTPSASVTTTATSASPTASVSSLINLSNFRADPRFTDIDGSGFAVVTIDTGIDLNHPFFGPDLDGNGIADRIVYQHDFGDRDNNASDLNGHGSHVASIIGSSDNTYTGVAPGVNLIALKVFRDNGSGYFSDLEKSLQWVVANAQTHNIASVNLSLGDGRNWSTAGSYYGIGDELAALAAMNIIVTAAAGNSFYEFNSWQGVAYPAADPNTIAVGAVWSDNLGGIWNFSNGAQDYTTAADRIASFSQRDADLLDVFAPGTRIIGANANGGTSTLTGTSQAAPYIAGVAALAQQLAVQQLGRQITVAEFRELLATTGVMINDGDNEDDNVTNTGINFARVNVLALAEKILTLSPEAPTSGTTGSGTTGPGSTPTLGAQSLTHTINLTSGQVVTGIDFGNQRLAEMATLTFSAAAYSVNEDSTSVTSITITRTSSNGTLTATLTLADGTATAPADYDNTPIIVEFADGEASKIVTIPIIDDAVVEGNETLSISLGASSSYELGDITTATVTIVDNDIASVTITESDGSTNVTEGGATDSYTVVLTSQPTADVSITINGDSQVSTDVNTLTFTAANWNVAQTVTVTAVDDEAFEGNHSSTLTMTAASSDAKYDGIAIASVNVNITDNDTIINGTSGSDTLIGTNGNNIITGFQGADILTGGEGKDQFVYTSIRDAGDTITDFVPGTDTIVLTQLFQSLRLSHLNYETATAQGYLRFGTNSAGGTVLIDPDGFIGRAATTTLLTVQGVSQNDLASVNNFIF
ncbi:CARDB domain-containing protein,putative collagen-binding protein,Calx-beta domain-containing protein,subtilase family protease [Nostoc sp. PCC 7524]|uniref:CARDB domain-containing protein n=1 Tax=Nostoc sp. (strain ATCC 29411 / PCC 7524) TaxID=28072 RepID=UPI00029ED447|nr:CARDB domain-containing protein [Nostoc sp. PCC 7524]AFY47683.1 CARDB domain-containing protein,putative collagen-binding protein,Calx-beta domain-containing protein,subtilase family protease [Nostoc sp. PCC 7524]